ncbi:pentapeptide repeat-containing protein [Sinomonas sp. JGH33]|uniref:Pentapeptide repeat-containing protein n=1 Tax=Sinomonas terricola TaxID=3110330 RepID=A0ABU5T594_9MICC|nr:pentapeptide repeat-containing protein [Sinomonas sp. JGH33]MEA5454837.1 pentapeptide repeat-containing protein [Sinomonas sp. JGH33]
MSPRKESTRPRLSELRLDRLEAGFAGDVEAGARIEGLAFDGADLADRGLAGITFVECLLRDVSLHNADLTGASFVETRMERLSAPVLSAQRSRFRDAEIEGSRIGSAELYDGAWDGTLVRGCKLGFVNLRGAKLADVLFEDCVIEELDLGRANAARVAFDGCTIDSLDVTGAELAHVDLRGSRIGRIGGIEGLRGAIVSPFQAAELAEALAEHLGIAVQD